MKILAAIAAFIAYSFVFWWVGVWIRRNLRMRSELNKIKAKLSAGNQLSEAWYQHYRKAGLALVGLCTLSVLFPLLAAAWSYRAEYRAEGVLMFTLSAVFPTLLGWLGVIPIPGLDIEQ